MIFHVLKTSVYYIQYARIRKLFQWLHVTYESDTSYNYIEALKYLSSKLKCTENLSAEGELFHYRIHPDA